MNRVVLGWCACLVGASVSLAQTPVRVLTLNEARAGTCQSVNWAFSTGNAFATARLALLDPSTIGLSGQVGGGVELLPAVPFLTPEAMVGADVVLITNSRRSPSRCEQQLLAEFVRQGGGLLAFENYAALGLGIIFGAESSATPGSGCGIVSNAAHPVVNGPFGNVTGCVTPNYHLTYTQVGPNGSAFLQSNGPVGASFTHGSGRAIMILDEEWIMGMTVSGCGAGSFSQNNAKLMLNSAAFVLPASGFEFDPAGLVLCLADVDDGTFTGTADCGVTIDDLLYYLHLFGTGDLRADFDDGTFTGNPDGGVTIDDLLFFLLRYEAGC